MGRLGVFAGARGGRGICRRRVPMPVLSHHQARRPVVASVQLEATALKLGACGRCRRVGGGLGSSWTHSKGTSFPNKCNAITDEHRPLVIGRWRLLIREGGEASPGIFDQHGLDLAVMPWRRRNEHSWSAQAASCWSYTARCLLLATSGPLRGSHWTRSHWTSRTGTPSASMPTREGKEDALTLSPLLPPALVV